MMNNSQQKRMGWILFWTFWSIFALTCLGVLAMLFLDFGSVQKSERSILVNAFLVETAVAIGALFYSLFRLRPPTKQPEDRLGVQRIEKREHYIDAHTASINNATQSIILFVSKLHAEDDSADAQKINAAIRRIAIRGISVQILVGANDDRLSGAIPLLTQENVIVRFDPTVTLSDVSYLCIDSKLVIIGVKRSKQNGYTPSKEWYSIHSVTMVRSLVEIFEKKWLSPATLTLEQMLRRHLPAHIESSGEEAISTQIGLPIDQVRKYRIPHPFVIFLIGRPGCRAQKLYRAMVLPLIRCYTPY